MKLAARCEEGGTSWDTYSGESVGTTVLRQWGGHKKVEGREIKDHSEKDCQKREGGKYFVESNINF